MKRVWQHFKKLKEMLTSPAVLAFPDLGKRIVKVMPSQEWRLRRQRVKILIRIIFYDLTKW